MNYFSLLNEGTEYRIQAQIKILEYVVERIEEMMLFAQSQLKRGNHILQQISKATKNRKRTWKLPACLIMTLLYF